VAEIQNPVLVVVDMQKGFINEHSEHIVKRVDALIRNCQEFRIPVVFSRFFNVEGSPFESLIGWDRLHGEPETEIVDELAPWVEDLIEKHFYTTITSEFIERTTRYDWKTIVLCGIATESCVLKTAADTFELGLRPIVISDACASDMGEASHLAGLVALESLIGKDQIMTTNELIELIECLAA
jgi:nicotinamidase-related amidase